jgi:glycerophosphoryl diester phosphodiesterase
MQKTSNFLKKSKFLLGHRGDPKNFRENTMASFESCLKKQADGFETDIFLSSDLHLMVRHDKTFEDGTDITQLNFQSIKLQDPEIPTLNEVLDGFPDSLIDIEIKADENRTHEISVALCESLKSHNLNNVLITSFSLNHLKDVRSLCNQLNMSTSLCFGLLFYPTQFNDSNNLYEQTLNAIKSCIKNGFDFFLPHFIAVYNQQMEMIIDNIKLGIATDESEQALFLVPWTVNDKQIAQKLLDSEIVKGIISDYPNLTETQ